MLVLKGFPVRLALFLIGLSALSACDVSTGKPGALKSNTPDLTTSAQPLAPSARSDALSRYYTRVQNHLQSQDLLRMGGGGMDTPYTREDVARNFERIAFYDEYVRGAGLRTSSQGPDILRRWVGPVRMQVEFGNSVPEAVRSADAAIVGVYAARLARVTGHPISVTGTRPNFYVLISSEDDREMIVDRVRDIVPDIGTPTLEIIRNPPRSIYCMVLTFISPQRPDTYNMAIALIRSEQPDLMRQSCIHEELAQGLGLGNDSAVARPSIFNDDEEFALLTSHDEELLRLLYHPSLKPGMSLGQARPVIQRILADTPGL